MFEQTLSLIGKPLNAAAMQAFLTENGYKPAKRPEISGISSERDFWLEHKKIRHQLFIFCCYWKPTLPASGW